MNVGVNPAPLALQLPLNGICLIEAGAGTGKTYTIADFFVRQLIEGGRDIKAILVVTFTRAATEELRNRIRKRLLEATAAFSKGWVEDDNTLETLLRTRTDHDIVVRELNNAITRMDETAIFTIHSFCQRMLLENAFYSGAPFDSNLDLDQDQLLETIIEDFWRRRFYPESRPLLEVVRRIWPTPKDLMTTMRPCFGVINAAIKPHITLEELNLATREYQNLLSEIPERWRDCGTEVTEILRHHKGLSRARDKYHEHKVNAMLNLMDKLTLADQTHYLLPEPFRFFSQQRIIGLRLKTHSPPQHPFFAFCQALEEKSLNLQRLIRGLVMREAIEYVRTELSRRKSEINAMSYDDLLTGVLAALTREQGTALQAVIRRRFPVALIDEFQDTDPVQYAIFHLLYRGHKDLGLFLIGDPKQAIYGFRGADIFTYMAARHAVDKHFSLPVNWRSSDAMVRAVNALFSGAAGRAFVFHGDIQFTSALSAGKADEKPLVIDDKQPKPIAVWYLGKDGEKFLSKTKARLHLAPTCAAEIKYLIDMGQAGRARLGTRPLQAEDIAVLVRNRYDAEDIRTELSRVQIASVFISQDSVYSSAEADDLERLLAAVATPADEDRLRGVLCSHLLGVNAEQLYHLRTSEAEWERCLERFQQYRDVWANHGFMAMFQRLLVEEDIIRRVLGGMGGERAMTNLRHLGELLQSASQTHPGLENLLGWFRRERRLADGGSEDQQLRLEADEKLVKIVTIHKSKGLQYPVVFLPFAWSGQRSLRAKPPLLYHQGVNQGPVLDLGSDDIDEGLTAVEKERLAEDVRLLYVAITRAEYLCYLPFAAVSTTHKGKRTGFADSGLAWLLYQQSNNGPSDTVQLSESLLNADDDLLRAPWEALVAQHPDCFHLENLSSRPHLASSPFSVTPPPLKSARTFTGPIVATWQITSYSRLSSTYRQFAPTVVGSDLLGESDSGANNSDLSQAQRERTVFSFPKGPKAGNLIHTLMERIDFPEAQGQILIAEISRCLARFEFESEWQSVLEILVTNILDTQLSPKSRLRLRNIDRDHRLTELEFHFPVTSLDAPALNRFLHQQIRGTPQSEPLVFDEISGFMTGFIDLAIEDKGLFYIIDYKSNHLGDHAEDYAGEALSRAMIEHQYDLQYLIYVAALNNYLDYRIPDYHYDTHFGGVYYLFVRGMEGRGQSKNGIFFQRPSFDVIQSLDALLRPEQRAPG